MISKQCVGKRKNTKKKNGNKINSSFLKNSKWHFGIRASSSKAVTRKCFCFFVLDDEKSQLQEELTAANGANLETQKIISEALSFVRESVIDSIKKRTGTSYKNSDIQWVLTIPAIWSQEVRTSFFVIRKFVAYSDRLCN